MKILLVIDDYISSNNGTTVSCRRFAGELTRQGHEVRILGVCEEDEENTYQLGIYHLPLFDKLVQANDFRFAQSNESIMEQAIGWADVVHCMMPYHLTYDCVPVIKRLYKPMTAAFHIQPENLLSAVKLGKVKPIVDMMYAVWRRWIYKPFHFIHVPSQFMKDELLKHNYKADIRVISNGIDPAFHLQKHYKSSEYKDKIVITMVGRLAREKRQDLIIRAVQELPYVDKIQLVFAGMGPLRDYYEQLSSQLPNKPQFVYYDQAKLIDLLAQTDVYVHASDMESEAIACIEALATGLVPIISDSKKSATRQFALDDRSLFKAGDAHDLAKKIDYWLSHPKEKEEMSARYAEEGTKYSLENSVKECVQMFEDAIHATSQTPSYFF